MADFSPANVPSGLVVGIFSRLGIDGTDADLNPDETPLPNVRAKFVPQLSAQTPLKLLRNLNAVPPRIHFVDEVEVSSGTEGALILRADAGVRLTSNMAPGLTPGPGEWTWRCELYRDNKLVEAFTFNVPLNAGESAANPAVDLATLVPVAAGTPLPAWWTALSALERVIAELPAGGGTVDPQDVADAVVEYFTANPLETGDIAGLVDTLNGKVNETTTASRVYGTSGAGAQTLLGYGKTASNDSLMQRTSNGQAVAADATSDDALVTRRQLQALGGTVTARPATDLPTTYPTGISVMEVGDDATWPVKFAVVETIRYGVNRSYQTIVERATGRFFLRTPTPTDAGWNTWVEYVSAGTLQAGLDGKIAKLVGTGRLAGTSATGVPVEVAYGANAVASAVVQRDGFGQVLTPTPTSDSHAANRKFVVDTVGGVTVSINQVTGLSAALDGLSTSKLNKPTTPAAKSAVLLNTDGSVSTSSAGDLLAERVLAWNAPLPATGLWFRSPAP